MNNIKGIIDPLKNEVETELFEFFNLKKKEAKKINQEIFKLVEAIEEFTMRGGKRLRSILMILTYQGYKKENKEIVKLSIIWELLQSFLLIHDDIIDKDLVRRGGKTMHIKLSDYYKNDHLGLSQSILCGDLLSLWSNQILARFKNKNIDSCIELINREIANVIYGEMVDVLDWRKDKDKTKRIETIQRLKTVSYTTLGPIKSGSILAGAPEKDIKYLDDFSTNLGLAFQTKDDLLGVFGESKKTGKSIMSDTLEGKLTYLVSFVKENGNPKDIKFLDKCLGNKKLTKSNFDKLKGIYIQTGAKKYLEKLINNYSEKALNLLEKTSINKTEKDTFKFLVRYLIDRKN